MKWGTYIIVLILLAGIAEAATIQGSVYDFGLEKISNVKVTINTEPKQQIVTVNGDYSFEVDAGSYEIIAYQIEEGRVLAVVKENINISQDGDFVLDLILFPSFEEEENILEETKNLDVGLEEKRASDFMILILFGLMVILAGLVYLAYLKYKKYKNLLFLKEKKPELPKDLQEVVDFIKKEGGRTTQKDIRKQFFLSEGKISLMISELEEKGVLKRIKKGRGNIVVLK